MQSVDWQQLVLDKLNQLQSDVSGLRENVDGLSSDVSGLRENVDGLSLGVSGLKENVGTLQLDVSGLKEDVAAMKQRQEAIFAQTAGLLEFRTETLSSIKEIKDTLLSASQMLGEHEIQIRNLMRKAIS